MKRRALMTASLCLTLSACVEFGTTFSLGNGIDNALTRVAAIASVGSADTLLLAYEDGGDTMLGLRAASIFDSDLEDTLEVDFTPVGATAHPAGDSRFLVATTDDAIVEIDYFSSTSVPSFFSETEFPVSFSGGFSWVELCDIDGDSSSAYGEFYLVARTSGGLSIFTAGLNTSEGETVLTSERTIPVDSPQCGAVAYDPNQDVVYVAALDDGVIYELPGDLSSAATLYHDSGETIIDIDANRSIVGMSTAWFGATTVTWLLSEGAVDEATLSKSTALTSRKHSATASEHLLAYDLESDGDLVHRQIQAD